MSSITKEDVKKIASLSMLNLSGDELDKRHKEFDQILDYISLLDEVDTNEIEEAHHLVNYLGDVLHEDEVEESLVSSSDLLSNANNRTHMGYILTRPSKKIDEL